MTIEDKIREIALASVTKGDFIVATDEYFYNLCVKAYNLGIETVVEEAETTHDSAWNVIVDKNTILKLRINGNNI